MSLKIKWAKFTLCHANEMSIFKKWAKFTDCMSHADATTLRSTCHFSPPLGQPFITADMHGCEILLNGF